MNDPLRSMYPPVEVRTPMPAGAPPTLLHRGKLATLPGKFDHATATYLLSLFDYPAAQQLCEGNTFEPIPMMEAATRRAVGHVCVVDYHQTDVGPYREWLLALWVVPRGERLPVLHWVNPTSLAFFAVLGGDKGFTSFSPKMFLTEPLPTEIGVEYYGIPKEMGQVSYQRNREGTLFEVRTATGQWIMRAKVPTTRGLLARSRVFLSLVRAFGLGACLRVAWRKEMPMTLAGSAKLSAKRAFIVAKVDPHAEFLTWDDRDCHFDVNQETEWGKRLGELGLAPALVCHVPNLAFVFSGPLDQQQPRCGGRP
jgi:hypothetical protein